ncbi:MAG TPA: DUF1206 domain-containing protein [Propionibacteriaceae bacterium]|nr:DUF1206 domain-containing protein [Propionibacteriaceae bacterium]
MTNQSVATSLAEVRRSRPYQLLVKVGLISYGVVHLLVAWIAVQIAFGRGGDASPNGAFASLGKQPAGAVLLWLMAIGLLTLSVWQIIEATVGRDDPRREGKVKGRARSAGRALVYLVLGLLAIGVALGAAEPSGKSEETLSAKLMALPFGPALVAAVGAGVIAVGVSQIIKGLREKFLEDLDQGVGKATRWLGKVGYPSKGVALSIVGVLFGWAALTYDPQKAGGMDAALTTIRNQPFGTVLLVIMAAGIACFGIYCFFWARMARY